MVKYVYVSVKSNRLIGSEFTEHREIIDEYAKAGYRYIGYIPTKITDHGKLKAVDLIFEIEEN